MSADTTPSQTPEAKSTPPTKVIMPAHPIIRDRRDTGEVCPDSGEYGNVVSTLGFELHREVDAKAKCGFIICVKVN